MPLIEEIETALPFVAELPPSLQKMIVREMARWIIKWEEHETMTVQQRLRLDELKWEKLGRVGKPPRPGGVKE